jgi:hypothetical protein
MGSHPSMEEVQVVRTKLREGRWIGAAAAVAVVVGLTVGGGVAIKAIGGAGAQPADILSAVSLTGVNVSSKATAADSSRLPGIGSSAASWRQRHIPFDGDTTGGLFGPVLKSGDPTYFFVTSGTVAGKKGRLNGYRRKFPSGTSFRRSMVLVREELPADTSMKEVASGPYCVLNEASSASFTSELPGKSVYLTTYTKDKVVGDRSEITNVNLSIVASGLDGSCLGMPPLS